MDIFEGRVALVTGGAAGIGREIARGLARAGLHVLLGVRDAARGREAAFELSADGAVEALLIDVTDAVSVEAAAAEIEYRFGRLDILINNAGINGSRCPPSEVTIAEMRTVFETNVFAIVGMINAMLPLLRRSAGARIVNLSSHRSLSSSRAFDGRPSMAYGVSKSAVNAVTRHYAHALAPLSIKVNAAAPGHCATALNGFSGPRTPTQGARVVLDLALLADDYPSGALFDELGPIPS